MQLYGRGVVRRGLSIYQLEQAGWPFAAWYPYSVAKIDPSSRHRFVNTIRIHAFINIIMMTNSAFMGLDR